MGKGLLQGECFATEKLMNLKKIPIIIKGKISLLKKFKKENYYKCYYFKSMT